MERLFQSFLVPSALPRHGLKWIYRPRTARRRRELMEMMVDLRSMGADALIDLPAVVVIGGQSAGKSSLVEAVSGINVPRDSGTCTRCPMECTMSSDATSWSCTITLRIGVSNNGREQKPMIVPFGRTITDRNEVEIWLRRAQTAILNPHVPSSSFHTKTIEELKDTKNTLKFSCNVVCVSIKDPDATELSFYDLPGLIQNEEADTVALVKGLAEHYTKKENTIILTTIPMSDDMENQQSMTLAREADPTSPWKDVADRRRFGIPGFVSDISRLLIQLIEEALPRLREDVDRLLANCNRELDALPLPLTNDPQIEVLERVNAFCDVFKSFVNGSHEDKRLAQRNRALYAIFKSEIRGTAPDFRPFEKPEEYVPLDDIEGDMILTKRAPGVSAIGINDVRKIIKDAIGWELPNNVPYQAKVNLITQFTKLWVTPSERCLAAINNVLAEVIDDLISIHFGRFRVLEDYVGNLIRIQVNTCKAHTQNAVKTALDLETTPHYTQNTHYLQTIREKWLTHYRVVRSNPIQYKARNPIQYKARNPIPQKARSKTPELRESKDDTDSYVKAVPEFKEYPSPKPLKTNKQRVQEVAKSFGSCSVLDYPEKEKPTSGWGVAPIPILAPPWYPSSPVVTPEVEAKALMALAEAGYPNLKVSDLSRLLPPDSFEEELIVMADVRAYYHVAYKRIIDHIPFTIEHGLHHALAKQLSQSLLVSLLTDVASGSNFSDRMKELVSEDASITQKRVMLSTRKERLSDIRRRLVTFSNST
ncbi:hypothetical protein AZE42_06890 [Rhizopogon vesiculosus]|uniref:GED domain-containing protein n=1 Tax=Rhizopogon vesiculosus TaxID=180088 RepID=A0A1J8Q0Y8_9AGAM|nr:hypothetical protein AZE42_06890 [Rhizopogon vesiculosus]